MFFGGLEAGATAATADARIAALYTEHGAQDYVCNGKAYINEVAEMATQLLSKVLGQLCTFGTEKLLVNYSEFWLMAEVPNVTFIKQQLVKHPLKKLVKPTISALKAVSKDMTALKAFVRDAAPFETTMASDLITQLTGVMHACLIASYIKKIMHEPEGSKKIANVEAMQAECKQVLKEAKATILPSLLKKLTEGHW